MKYCELSTPLTADLILENRGIQLTPPALQIAIQRPPERGGEDRVACACLFELFRLGGTILVNLT